MSKFGHLLAIKQLLPAFCCTCEQGGKQNAPPASENRAKKLKTIQALVRRLANEQNSYARAALGSFRGAVCWRLFSLSPLSRSSFLRFVFKNRLGEARARKAATRMVWDASRVNLRAVGACEGSSLRSEASKPVLAKMQKPTKSNVSLKRRNL